MKNVFRIYKRDLKNIFTNWVAFVVTLALIILPSLYGWFNIKSSWDPYGNTKGIKVAIVNEDIGGTFSDKEYKLGDEIVSNLKENDQIGWKFVDKEEAEKGVKNGKYYASILIPNDFSEKLLSMTGDVIVEPSLIYTVNEKTNAIAPKITDKGVNSVKDEISTNVVKTVDGIIFKVLNEVGIEAKNAKPKIRKLVDTIYTVDANMPKIEDLVNQAYDGTITVDELVKKANSLMPTVEDTIKTSQDVLNKSNEYLSKAQSGIKEIEPIVKQDLIVSEEIVSGINNLLNSIDEKTTPEKAKEILTQVKDKATTLDKSLDSLIKVLESINKMANNNGLTDIINTLKGIKTELGTGIDLVNMAIEDANNGVITGSDKFQELRKVVNDINSAISKVNNNYDSKIKPAIENGITEINKISGNGIYLLNEAESSVPDINKVLFLAGKGVDIGKEDLSKIKEELPELKEKVHTYAEKLRGVDDEAKVDELLDLIINDWQSESTFLSSPIKIDENKLFPVPNYGSGMSPFFTTLSLWVGALLLVSLFTTHAKSLEEDVPLRPLEEYFGKYLTFISVGIVQGLIATLGDIFLLKTYVVHPIIFVFYGIFISITFMTLIYTLVSVFGNVGKAIAVILLVLQISASGGTFPVEVMPEFFQKIHPLLPFKYAIGAMREAVAGIVPELLIKDTLLLLVCFGVSLILGITLKGFANKRFKKFVDKLADSGIVGH